MQSFRQILRLFPMEARVLILEAIVVWEMDRPANTPGVQTIWNLWLSQEKKV
jgi:hypothetical protein